MLDTATTTAPTPVVGQVPQTLVIALFWLSGAAGLVYEVVWARYLGFVIGTAASATALVLAVFLGGLALGSVVIGRVADRVANPLYLYAWLEISIGLLGGLSPWALTALWGRVVGVDLGLAGRMAVVAAVLVVPCALMGGTLPLLTRHFSRAIGEVQGRLAMLYFLNSAGAAIGVLVAGMFLIPTFGLDAAACVAAFVNVGVGVVALGLSKQGAPPPVEVIDPIAPEPAAPLAFVCAAAALMGFVALAYEVAWNRLLALVMGGSNHAFTLMLAAFVGGIALGSFCVQRDWVRGSTTMARFAIAQLGLAAAVLITLPLYARLPFDFAAWSRLLAPTPQGFTLFQALQFGTCLLLMGLPTTCLGIALPLAARLAVDDAGRVGQRVGQVFAFNTLGNVLGALAATFLLLPLLGVKSTILLGAAVNLGLGLWAGALAGWPLRPRAIYGGMLGALLGAQLALAPTFDMRLMGGGLFRGHAPSPDGFARDRAQLLAQRIRFQRDDAVATVMVTSSPDDRDWLLSVNGKVDASSRRDLATEVGLAQIPLCLRPRAKNALVIGLGSGIAAGSALTHPLERLDVVEVAPAVVEAARLFAPFNRGALDDPRLHMHTEDALGFLQRPGPRYDVIVAEPSNPWVAGVSNLFSAEAFQFMASRLSPGGVVAQWIHVYETDDATLRLVLRTFRWVFPEVTLWTTQAGDLVIMGSLAPIDVPFDEVLTRIGLPAVKADLARIGIHRLPTLLAQQSGTPAGTIDLLDEGGIHTLRLPLLESMSAYGFFAGGFSRLVEQRDMRVVAPARGGGDLWLARYAAKTPMVPADFAEILAMFEVRLPDWRPLRRHMVAMWRASYPTDVGGRLADVACMADDGAFEAASELLGIVRDTSPKDPVLADRQADLDFRRLMARVSAASDTRALAAPVLRSHERLLVLQPADQAGTYARIAAIHTVTGDRLGAAKATAAAVALLEPRAKADPGARAMLLALWNAAAASAFDDGDDKRVTELLTQIYRLEPDEPRAHALEARLLNRRRLQAQAP